MNMEIVFEQAYTIRVSYPNVHMILSIVSEKFSKQLPLIPASRNRYRDAAGKKFSNLKWRQNTLRCKSKRFHWEDKSEQNARN